MGDWISKWQEEKAAIKAAEEAAIAEFIAAGKVTHLGYFDEKAMKKSQKYSYHLSRASDSDRSAKIVAKQQEEDKYCIFSRAQRMSK